MIALCVKLVSSLCSLHLLIIVFRFACICIEHSLDCVKLFTFFFVYIYRYIYIYIYIVYIYIYKISQNIEAL